MSSVRQGRLHAAPVCGAGEVEGHLLPIHFVLEQRMAECSLSGTAISVQICFRPGAQNGRSLNPAFRYLLSRDCIGARG